MGLSPLLLLTTCSENMDHLIETTHLEHYELYRTSRLGEMGFPEGHGLVPLDRKIVL